MPEDVAQRRADKRTARSVTGQRHWSGAGSSDPAADDDGASVSSSGSGVGAGSSDSALGVKFDWDFALRELLLHSPEAPLVNPDGLLLLGPRRNRSGRRSTSRSSLGSGSLGSGGPYSDSGGSDDGSARRSADHVEGRSGSRGRAGSARRSREFPFLAAGAPFSAAAGALGSSSGGSSRSSGGGSGLRGSHDSLSSLGKASSQGRSSVNSSFEGHEDDEAGEGGNHDAAYYDEGYQRLLALECKV